MAGGNDRVLAGSIPVSRIPRGRADNDRQRKSQPGWIHAKGRGRGNAVGDGLVAAVFSAGCRYGCLNRCATLIPYSRDVYF
jgi:hypothetical protein